VQYWFPVSIAGVVVSYPQLRTRLSTYTNTYAM
jgi:hypothetical protein